MLFFSHVGRACPMQEWNGNGNFEGQGQSFAAKLKRKLCLDGFKIKNSDKHWIHSKKNTIVSYYFQMSHWIFQAFHDESVNVGNGSIRHAQHPLMGFMGQAASDHDF